jgi:hypothetical protein
MTATKQKRRRIIGPRFLYRIYMVDADGSEHPTNHIFTRAMRDGYLRGFNRRRRRGETMAVAKLFKIKD